MDIHREILNWSNLLDAISFLRTCKELYFSQSFWYHVLANARKKGPLACPPGSDLTAMDLPELSRLGFRTAALMSNWSLGRPAIKSVKQLMLGTYEHLFRIIPGTNLVLTQEATLPWDKATIRCWDFLRVRCIGAIEIARNPLAWHHTHVSCIEVPGIATIGFIAGSLPSRVQLTLVQIDYTDSEAITFKEIARLPLPALSTAPTFWLDFSFKISADTVTIMGLKQRGSNVTVEFASFHIPSIYSTEAPSIVTYPQATFRTEENHLVTQTFFTWKECRYVVVTSSEQPHRSVYLLRIPLHGDLASSVIASDPIPLLLPSPAFNYVPQLLNPSHLKHGIFGIVHGRDEDSHVHELPDGKSCFLFCSVDDIPAGSDRSPFIPSPHNLVNNAFPVPHIFPGFLGSGGTHLLSGFHHEPEPQPPHNIIADLIILNAEQSDSSVHRLHLPKPENLGLAGSDPTSNILHLDEYMGHVYLQQLGSPHLSRYTY